MAPPNSYIHSEDFPSGAALVEYLDYLDKNDTAYLEYHAWRKMEPKPNDYLGVSAQMPCDLCKEVKRRKAAGWANRMIKSVGSYWWINVHDDRCSQKNFAPDLVLKLPPVMMNTTYDELPRG